MPIFMATASWLNPFFHMNGRVYDPQIGRFLSADPFVQAPESSQSFNRYSYVMNNPLSLVDPSGYFASSPIDYGFDNNADLGVVLGNENIIDANLTLWQAQLDQTLGTDLLGRYDTGQTYTNYELKALPIAFEAKFNHDKSFRDGWLQEVTQVFQQESLPIAPAPSYPEIDRVALQYQINNQIDHQLMGLHSSETLNSYRTTTGSEVYRYFGSAALMATPAGITGTIVAKGTAFSLGFIASVGAAADQGSMYPVVEQTATLGTGRGFRFLLGEGAEMAHDGLLILRNAGEVANEFNK